MLRRFRDDRRGNYAMLTALVMVPIMGALALAVDYVEMSNQRQAALNALDAAGIATARRIAEGASDAEALAYAQDFFDANLGEAARQNARLHVVLPGNNAGGGTLKLSAELDYQPTFFPVFQWLRGEDPERTTIALNVDNEIRLKNTLEVALVLDNSGSMDEKGSGSGKKRLDLLKEAAKQLVNTLAAQAGMMKQVARPVQFGLVPFAASVNVGPDKAGAPWMDTDGLSPIHHENFDWTTMPDDRRVQKVGDVYKKRGSGWGEQEDQKVTRLTLFGELTRISDYERKLTGTRREYRCSGRRNCRWVDVPVYEDVPVYTPLTSWAGCVEMRPHPHSLADTPASASQPETLFVPMFAPDEADGTSAYNSWWADMTSGGAAARQAAPAKYFEAVEMNGLPSGKGPNLSCTTKPITPLTDVTAAAGLATIENAIDGMRADGATNVPEGLAWGWRVVSGRAPFTDGRPDNERGNDKVVIVLTDGANTYYTPQSLGASDAAGNRSIYSNYGYAKTGRIFAGTSVNSSDFSNGNYTKAMNSHLADLCQNAKDDRIILITVALDLNSSRTDEREQIAGLKACASESRFRKDPETGGPAKLFWNATGAELAEKFKEIADELSNLRIVG